MKNVHIRREVLQTAASLVLLVFLLLLSSFYATTAQAAHFTDEVLSDVNTITLPEDVQQLQSISNEILIEKAMQSISTKDMPSANEQAQKSMEKLKYAEFYSIHGYAPGPVMYSINTPSAPASSAFASPYLGTLYCNDWGMSVKCYYSDAQSVVDARNSAAILTPRFGSHPFGLGASIVADHNIQTGHLWGKAKIGQKIYAKTPYGEFIYEVVRTGLASNDGDVEFYMYDDNMAVFNYARSGQFNGLIMYTCYPFDRTNGKTERFIVFAKLVDGTTMT